METADRRAGRPHPMLAGAWPGRQQIPALDVSGLRRAIAGKDVAGFLAAVSDCDIDDALQQLAAGLPRALAQQPGRAEPVTLSVINRLTQRAGPGDQVLAGVLLALLRGEPLPGRAAPVDLEMLGIEREDGDGMSTGGYLDLRSGQVYGENATDPAIVGEDAAIDIDSDPDRWLWFERVDSHDAWRDMADFAARQYDTALRERMQRAIEGKGAFRRFRDITAQEGLLDQWHTFTGDRQLGRARELLADQGIHVS